MIQGDDTINANLINKFKYIATFIILIAIIIALYFLFLKIYEVLHLELLPTYTWDSPIYWAVGRGMLNGIQPYSGLFETKPPGIYYVSAISLLFTNDVLIGNLINAICLLFICLTPFVFTLLYYRKNKNFTNVIILFISLVCGTSIMFYTSLRSGKYQVESYGAGFASLYLLLVVLNNNKKLKFNSSTVILSGLFALISIMFKEPFLLIIIASSLIFINNVNDLKYKLI